MSAFYNSHAKPEYLDRWAAWMLSSRWVGIYTTDERHALNRELLRRR